MRPWPLRVEEPVDEPVAIRVDLCRMRSNQSLIEVIWKWERLWKQGRFAIVHALKFTTRKLDQLTPFQPRG